MSSWLITLMSKVYKTAFKLVDYVTKRYIIKVYNHEGDI